MVHSWIILRNDKVTEPCLNSRVTRLFKRDKAFFYGDYDLDVYLASKHDYKNLESVVGRVIDRSSGWVTRCSLADGVVGEYRRLHNIISEFGRVDDDQIHKFVPRKESCELMQSVIYRKDGNFALIGCETDRFYFVFAFDTS